MKNSKSMWICKLLLALGVCLLFTNVLLAANAIIPPSDDAFVEDFRPDSNPPIVGVEVYVGDENWDGERTTFRICRTYLKFNLAGIPSGSTITSARIRLYSDMSGPLPNIVVGAHYLGNDTWSEGTITWNNAPTTFDPNPTDTKTVDNGSTHEYFWDVTSSVQTSFNADKVLSEVMKSEVDEGAAHSWCAFLHKEYSWPDLRPYLEVTYTTGIPTVSQWGLIVMVILLLTAGTVFIRQRRRATA